MREMKIPIALPVVDDHGKHLSHSMVHTFNSTVAIGVVSARGNFTNAKELVQSVVGKQPYGAAIVLDIVVDQNVCCASSSEVASSDSVHGRVSAEAVGEK